jgi:hypothetical protein
MDKLSDAKRCEGKVKMNTNKKKVMPQYKQMNF